MKFVYGPKELFDSVGFDTTHWRTSESGTHVLVHLQFAETLIPDLDNRKIFRVYDYQSDEFEDLIQEEFTPKPEPLEDDMLEDDLEDLSEESIEDSSEESIKEE